MIFDDNDDNDDGGDKVANFILVFPVMLPWATWFRYLSPPTLPNQLRKYFKFSASISLLPTLFLACDDLFIFFVPILLVYNGYSDDDDYDMMIWWLYWDLRIL